jgi:inner membrane protein
MDNLTHTLFAATLARTPLGRGGRGTTAALILASNAPDADIVATAAGAIRYLEWHRGPTHGVFGVVGLGLVTAGLVWSWGRWRGQRDGLEEASFGRLAVLSILGVLFHVLMDLPTSYGSRLLSPFNWDWWAIDLIPIIDVYLLVILAGGLLAGHAREARERCAAVALILMAFNYGFRAASHHRALGAAGDVFRSGLPGWCADPERGVVDRWPLPPSAPRRDECLVGIAALPTFLSPLDWRIVARFPGRYEVADIDILEFSRRGPTPPALRMERHPNAWTPAVAAAARTPTAQIYLGFARLAAAATRVDPDGSTIVRWRDLRFSAAGLPLDTEEGDGPFELTVRVGADGAILEERFGPG